MFFDKIIFTTWKFRIQEKICVKNKKLARTKYMLIISQSGHFTVKVKQFIKWFKLDTRVSTILRKTIKPEVKCKFKSTNALKRTKNK